MQARSVVLLAALLFSWNVWGYDLWAPDETYFGEGAREMVADGRWLVPHVNGAVSSDKPPLFFWLIAIPSLVLGGVSSLTARLPSVLAAVGSVLLTIRLGRRAAGEGTGALAGLLLATSYMFWEKARWAQIDSLLCFLVLAALCAFESFRAGRSPGFAAGILFWAAAACAALAKGPVGLLLPLGIALATLAFDRDLRRWRAFAPLAGPLVFTCIAGTWVLAVERWQAGYSVWSALREHFVERGLQGMHHAQPPWYYLEVLPYSLLPWSLLLPGALLLGWRRRHLPGDRFLLVAALFVIAFFSISTEKRNLYILPAFPAFALLMARLVTSAVEAPARGEPGVDPRWVTLPQSAIGALLLVTALAAPVVVGQRAEQGLLAPALALAAVLGAGSITILQASLRSQATAAVRRTALTTAAGFLVAATLVLPALDPIKSGRELGRAVRAATATPQPRQVLAYHPGNVLRAVNLYSGGVYLEEIADPARLIQRLSFAGETVLLANTDKLPDIPAELERRRSELFSTRLSRRDLVLLRFEPAGEAGR